MLPVEAGDGQTDYLVAGGGNALHFHTSQGADKQNFGVRVCLFYLSGYRQRREYMSSGATAADNDFHCV